MQTFPDYIRQRLERNGYKTINNTPIDLFMRTPEGDSIWVCYLDMAISPEDIRRAFEFKGHLLFVVDDKLIPQTITDRQSTPMWLRVLHGLYMGRIYTWNGRFLYGLHFDYDTGDISESGMIQPDELLLIETGTWLRGWTDQYKLARFYDLAWWGAFSHNESYYRDEKRNQPPNDDFRQRYENAQKQRENKQSYGYYGGTGSNPPKQETPGRDFGKEFRACDSLDEVKKLFRKLAKEFHPDFNQGKDTTAIMQAINAAYDRAKSVYA